MKHRFKKRICGLVSAVMALAMIVGLLPALTVPAEAADTIIIEIQSYAGLRTQMQNTYYENQGYRNVVLRLVAPIEVAFGPGTTISDLIEVKGNKVLELNGYQIYVYNNNISYTLYNPWGYKEGTRDYMESVSKLPYASNLFHINKGVSLTVNDASGGKGDVRYSADGVQNQKMRDIDQNCVCFSDVKEGNPYALQGPVYEYKRYYFRPIERNIFHNEGTLIINAGRFIPGREWEVKDTDYIHTVSGSAVLAKEGSTTIINGGKLYGRGMLSMGEHYYRRMVSYDHGPWHWQTEIDENYHIASSVVRLMGGKVYVNDGMFVGRNGAHIFNDAEGYPVSDKAQAPMVCGGTFQFHKSDKYVNPLKSGGYSEGFYGYLGIDKTALEDNLARLYMVYNGKTYLKNEINSVDLLHLCDGKNVEIARIQNKIIQTGDALTVTRPGIGTEPISQIMSWNPAEEPLTLSFPQGRRCIGMEWLEDYVCKVTWTIVDLEKSNVQYSYSCEYTHEGGEARTTDQLAIGAGVDWNSSGQWGITCSITENVPGEPQEGVIYVGPWLDTYMASSSLLYLGVDVSDADSEEQDSDTGFRNKIIIGERVQRPSGIQRPGIKKNP